MKAKYQSGTSFCIEISDNTSRTCMTVADAVRLKEELTKAIDDAEKDKEKELTVFEKGLNAFLFDFVHTTVEEYPTEYIKKNSAVLLALAKRQLLQSGELLTQEHHEKLMETLREECKKDLPMWKKIKAFDK